MHHMASLALAQQIENCRLCPRLVAYRESPPHKRPEPYWSKPVAGFGDPKARLLIMGLAPGAHGSNWTGRPFTGDASGNFLYPALYRAGMANQPGSSARDDGLELKGVYISAVVRCAPPQNRPRPEEIASCARWTVQETAELGDLKAVLLLGKIAHDTWLRTWAEKPAQKPFRHGAVYPGEPILIDSYHVSRQNTQTGRLTTAMFDGILQQAKQLARI